MLCEACGGTGGHPELLSLPTDRWRDCQDCIGGIARRSDGMQAPPEGSK
jgi:hypothetical protein